MIAMAGKSADYHLGDRLEFSSPEIDRHLLTGFSRPEPWGRWTDGGRARIEVRHGVADGTLMVELWVAHVHRVEGHCDLVIASGWGEPILFTIEAVPARIAFLAQAEEAAEPGVVLLDLMIPRPKAATDDPPDPRALGIGFAALRLSRIALSE